MKNKWKEKLRKGDVNFAGRDFHQVMYLARSNLSHFFYTVDFLCWAAFP